MLIDWFVAFFALFFVDIFWTRYVQSVQLGKSLAGAAWAVLLFVFGAVAVKGYVADNCLIIPSAAGAFFGTFVAIYFDKKETK